MTTDADAVILVDEADVQTGTMDKLMAHRQGALHRAVSVFVFNYAGDFLLQRRAAEKYHSGGLWSNACCSHPRPGEAAQGAASRRLVEEMGIRGCDLEPAFTFIYRANVGGGLIEHEYDHVFVGRFDGTPAANPAEVADWRWASAAVVADEVSRTPERFTAWFRDLFARASAHARAGYIAGGGMPASRTG